jgi:DNA-binding GntR family transcriptional regulator
MRGSLGLDDAASNADHHWNRVPARPTSSSVAAEYIRELIFDGRLRPGQRVPQDEVARALGLSRIPVREAIIALEREGFVTTQLHRGAFVSALDEDVVRDQYELYGRVYGFAAMRALERSDGAFIDELQVVEKRLSKADDTALFAELAVEYARIIVDAAASPRIKLVIRALPGLAPATFFAIMPAAMDVTKRGNRAVLKALEQGDGRLAAERFVVMMGEIGDHVVKLFDDRGLFTPHSHSGRG